MSYLAGMYKGPDGLWAKLQLMARSASIAVHMVRPYLPPHA